MVAKQIENIIFIITLTEYNLNPEFGPQEATFDRLPIQNVSLESLSGDGSILQVEVLTNPIKHTDESDIHVGRYLANSKWVYVILKKLYLGEVGVHGGNTIQNSIRDTASATDTPATVDNGIKIERFIKTARLIQSLDQSFILNVQDIMHSGGDYYILLQPYFMNGKEFSVSTARTLNNFFNTPEFTINRKVSIAKQIINIAIWLAKHGITHFDWKPSNILLDENWQVKLADFGLCIDRRVGINENERVPDPQRSIMAGTLAYTSPMRINYVMGIIQESELDYLASDIFTIGLIIFEIFTEEFFFNETTTSTPENPSALVSRILNLNLSDPNNIFTMYQFELAIDAISQEEISDSQKSALKDILRLLLSKDIVSVKQQFGVNTSNNGIVTYTNPPVLDLLNEAFPPEIYGDVNA